MITMMIIIVPVVIMCHLPFSTVLKINKHVFHAKKKKKSPYAGTTLTQVKFSCPEQLF
jgi:hypothetical protein